MLQTVLRFAPFVAFAVLGIVWSSNHDETTAALWVVSFALVVFAALQSETDGRALWARVPTPSKDPDDYR